ncbi:uncharacterized protein NP_1784A [Natronomonas pharaonis DSM 2160]|uniref:Uncharacterized protein n=1 Tax=Natronomonas pharaonis (strain ATCC 35678 / DSM 2160 / CIP 103997 / JCM 8858 / NBRC 14720 / NCIMB 2260 / Gabara) TaxID=348780 RepID=A0A1U7EVE1_NATPD|nr:hypothetical protein [Natronomonas pharaonis]CAI48983.1 uncharacterized protein NP_1784A [Natronomonas pharaonis DSM 2160]
MPRDEIEPMVPILPTDEQTETTARTDGGHQQRYHNGDVDAPLVPNLG